MINYLEEVIDLSFEHKLIKNDLKESAPNHIRWIIITTGNNNSAKEKLINHKVQMNVFH